MKKIIQSLLILILGYGTAFGIVITSTSINSGPTIGGYSITILNDISMTNPSVKIGDNLCIIESFGGTEIDCTVPAGAGNENIVVTQDLETSNPFPFSYDPPSVTNITPTELNRIGGDTVVINGDNFGASSAKVFIDGKECSSLTHDAINPHNSIYCTSPPGNKANSNVLVLQNNGKSVFSPITVSYNQCQPGFFEVGINCLPCAEGYFQDQAGQNSCKACAVGSASSNMGAIECTLCDAGTFQSQEGQTVCLDCSPGRFQDQIGQASCKSCAAGSASNATKATECSSCAVGTFQAQQGQTACLECSAGKYQDIEGSASCKDCPSGSASNISGASQCQDCDPGSFQDLTGQLNCKTCEAGTFSQFQGSNKCTLCPIESYQDLQGQAFCLTCPDGTTQPATGQPLCLGTGQCDVLYGLFRSGYESGNEPVVD